MLSDLLVVDLTRHLPGPYATLALADFGARVIKVEEPAGDPTRAFPPHGPDGVAALYRALNQGKRSLGLDLKRPEGQELLRRLARQADVLVEGFRPGVLARLGLDLARCRAENPRLVTCSLSGYGQDGPYRDRAGHDLNYQAYAGALSITAGADGVPVTPGLQLGDLSAALGALSGILLALHERARTGRGRAVDVSMLDALVSLQGLHFAAHQAGLRAEAGRMPLSGGLPTYGVFKTADGKAVALAALEPKFWAVFCDVVDRPEWVDRHLDPALRGELEALFRTRPRDEWRLILEDAGCCLAPVLSYDEVLEDPQVRARGLLTAERAAPPFRFAPSPAPPTPLLARRVGEHTAEILQGELGLSQGEVRALVASGVALA